MEKVGRGGTVAALVALSLLCTGCASQPKISVSNPWVRVAAAAQPEVLGYLSVESDKPVSLVKVDSPRARGGSLAAWVVKDDGLDHLVPVNSIELPAGKPVNFGRGSFQFKLLEPEQEFQIGQKIPVILTFRSGEREQTISIEADVRRPYPGGFGDGGGMPPSPGSGIEDKLVPERGLGPALPPRPTPGMR
jgi:periplasmic copper chaperone A